MALCVHLPLSLRSAAVCGVDCNIWFLQAREDARGDPGRGLRADDVQANPAAHGHLRRGGLQDAIN